MNLRGQILLGSILLTVLPMVLVIQVIRTRVEDRFRDLDTRRVEEQLRIVRSDLDRQGNSLSTLLDALATYMHDDNRFRLAVLEGGPDLRSYLLDYAPRHMSIMNLDMLLIQDSEGRVLSSGHFRDAYDAVDPNLPRLLGNAAQGRALLTARAPGGSFLALARTRTLDLGGRTFHLTGGLRLDRDRFAALMSRDRDLAAALIWPEGSLTSTDVIAQRLEGATAALDSEYRLRREGWIVQSVDLPLISAGSLGSAQLLVTHDRASLGRLLKEVNLMIGLILIVGVGAALLLAVLLAGRISRPLRDLAARTEDLDLDRLDVEFASTRRDEVGRLTRLLGEMTGRLRAGIARLQDAEHRATLGEVARQVNHDIRNGITPLRNVLRHLNQVADHEPQQLEPVFRQRQQTLAGGLAYLEDLAAHYARLSPGRQPRPSRLQDVVAGAVAAPVSVAGARMINRVPDDLPAVTADPVNLRRIIDNLLRNALESLPAEGGTVTVTAGVETDSVLDEPRIVARVTDTGCGIAPEHLDEVFNDFFTTRPDGTGLGLSNVRRLMGDCGGTIRVTSEPGRGTTFTLSFPAPGSEA